MPASSTWQWRSQAVTGASESLRGVTAESLRGDARLLGGDVAGGGLTG